MTKPLNENLASVRILTDDGELIPAMDYAGEQFSDLINSVTTCGKGGTLVLKITAKPSTAGALAIKAEVKVAKPKTIPAESLLWPTPEGNLLTSDPKQVTLPLKAVEAEPVRQLKSI